MSASYQNVATNNGADQTHNVDPAKNQYMEDGGDDEIP